jgi:hypothetical protein
MKKYGPPSAAEEVASLFRSRGINVDPERLELESGLAAGHAKRDFDAYPDQVETVAIAAKKARRQCELAEGHWRRNPGADTLAEAMAAQRHRNDAEAELRELLLHDEQLISAVKRRYGR